MMRLARRTGIDLPQKNPFAVGVGLTAGNQPLRELVNMTALFVIENELNHLRPRRLKIVQQKGHPVRQDDTRSAEVISEGRTFGTDSCYHSLRARQGSALSALSVEAFGQ